MSDGSEIDIRHSSPRLAVSQLFENPGMIYIFDCLLPGGLNSYNKAKVPFKPTQILYYSKNNQSNSIFSHYWWECFGVSSFVWKICSSPFKRNHSPTRQEFF